MNDLLFQAKASFVRGIVIFSRIFLDNPEFFFGFMNSVSESGVESFVELVVNNVSTAYVLVG